MIVVWRTRDCDLTVSIKLSDGSLYSYVANDVIRIKIGRQGSTPVLDLSSKAASTNGSTVRKANPTTVSLRKADIALLDRGFWEFEVIVVDDSDNDKAKHVDTHVLFVDDTQGGGVGI